MNWKIGDRAIFVNGEKLPGKVGTVVTVVSEPRNWGDGRMYVLTDPLIRSPNGCFVTSLAPIDDDSKELSSWEECVWKPESAKV